MKKKEDQHVVSPDAEEIHRIVSDIIEFTRGREYHCIDFSAAIAYLLVQTSLRSGVTKPNILSNISCMWEAMERNPDVFLKGLINDD